jgi:cysteine desulfurase/selenocysteine lyase
MEQVRGTVARFLHAHPDEIVFTSGATDSLRLVAERWGLATLEDGDEVALCPQDHQAAVRPWLRLQAVLAARGVRIAIKEFRTDATGDYDLDSLRTAVGRRTRVLAITHVHNVFGLEMSVQQLPELVLPGTVVVLDAAQSAGHVPVDVAALGVDFAAFSAHKVLGPTGVGVLWARGPLHPWLRPPLSPPEAPLSEVMEEGTPNIAGILGLGAALEYMDSLGVERAAAHLRTLTDQLVSRLRALPRITFLPGPGLASCSCGTGIVSFTVEGHDASDVGYLLAEHDICVRTGHHCMERPSAEDGSVRVSLHVYNGTRDVERIAEVLGAL